MTIHLLPNGVEICFCDFGPIPRIPLGNEDDVVMSERVKSYLYSSGAYSVLMTSDYLIKAFCYRIHESSIREVFESMVIGKYGIQVHKYVRNFRYYGTFQL